MTDRDLPALQATRAELEPHWPRPESIDALVEMLLDGLEHMRPGEAALRLDAVIAIEQLRSEAALMAERPLVLSKTAVSYGKLVAPLPPDAVVAPGSWKEMVRNYGVILVDDDSAPKP